VLAASVEQATQNFLEKGDQIAKESQDLKEELVAAVDDVRKQGMWNSMLNWVTGLMLFNIASKIKVSAALIMQLNYVLY